MAPWWLYDYDWFVKSELCIYKGSPQSEPTGWSSISAYKENKNISTVDMLTWLYCIRDYNAINYFHFNWGNKVQGGGQQMNWLWNLKQSRKEISERDLQSHVVTTQNMSPIHGELYVRNWGYNLSKKGSWTWGLMLLKATRAKGNFKMINLRQC